MSDSERSTTRPLWLALPMALHDAMERAGLSETERDLNIAAWSFSATRMSDGRLSKLDAKRLPSWSQKRCENLLGTGFWRENDLGYEIVGYLEVNRTKAEIERTRAANRLRQREWRGRNVPAGRTTIGFDSGQLDGDHADNALDNASDNGPSDAFRAPVLPDPYPYPNPQGQETGDVLNHRSSGAGSDETTEGVEVGPSSNAYAAKDRVEGKGIGLMPDWDSYPWSDVRDAWESRGLRNAPSLAQRRTLWPIVQEFPNTVGEWITAAPATGPSTFDIIGYVKVAAGKERANDRRQSMPEVDMIEAVVDRERSVDLTDSKQEELRPPAHLLSGRSS